MMSEKIGLRTWAEQNAKIAELEAKLARLRPRFGEWVSYTEYIAMRDKVDALEAKLTAADEQSQAEMALTDELMAERDEAMAQVHKIKAENERLREDQFKVLVRLRNKARRIAEKLDARCAGEGIFYYDMANTLDEWAKSVPSECEHSFEPQQDGSEEGYREVCSKCGESLGGQHP